MDDSIPEGDEKESRKQDYWKFIDIFASGVLKR
jgi:hypothetical protein